MLKNLLFILSFAWLATGCSGIRPTASKTPANPASENVDSRPGSSIQFIGNISIKPDAHQDKTGSSIAVNAPERASEPQDAANAADAADATRLNNSAGTIENYSALRFKYSILENASVEELANLKLLSFMDYWYGTRYHYGGTSREGIDCSAFAFLLMSSVYGVAALPRTAKEQFQATRRIRRNQLQEGDLVFFHTLGKHRAVTHVGVYLRNSKFIHASVSGVMISEMNDGYYDKHFVGAGRIVDPAAVLK
jgi:cell wall-associated NlpC family hydrolase